MCCSGYFSWNWPFSFFSFQLSSFSSLFQDVFNQPNWQFPHFQYTLPLTPCSTTSQEFFTHHPKLFYSPLTHPSQLISRPDLHPPLIHTTYQRLFLNGSTIHCQHFSSHFIQCFQFFVCPSYLLHTWSALTAAHDQFQFNLDFNISFSLLFYSLEFFFISFSFIKSASIIPRYLYLLSPISPIIRSYKIVIPSNLTFFSLVITNTVVIEGWNQALLASSKCRVRLR